MEKKANTCLDGLSKLSISSSPNKAHPKQVGSSPSMEMYRSSDDYAGSSSTEAVNLARLTTQYFRPVHEDYIKKLEFLQYYDESEFRIDHKLMKSLFHFTWGPDVFRAPLPLLKRLYKEISLQIDHKGKIQTDLNNIMAYLPVEAISAKLNQIVIAIAMVEPSLVSREFTQLELILDDERPFRDASAYRAYVFVFETLKSLYSSLSEICCEWTQKKSVPDYDLLNNMSKNTIRGLSVMFMKLFRVKSKERLQIIKRVHEEDPASLEWTLYYSDMLRMKRREAMSGNSKRPTQMELELVDLTFKMEPRNPFVRLNIIDCVIDAVRECNGRFRCGEHINLKDLDEAMKFLQDECRSLTQEFKKNIQIISIVSDYFVRYVPYSYFDKQYSYTLLDSAFKLNPYNPKTTHRLGIFFRMSMRKFDESLKWFEKTLELDPSHFNGNMDYFKMILGQPEKFLNVGSRMERTLVSDFATTWRIPEIADFQFYTGLAYLAEGNKEAALEHWMQVMKVSEVLFTLTEVDVNCSIYCWDDKHISAEKIRVWIVFECENAKRMQASKDPNYDSEIANNFTRMSQLMLGIVRPLRPLKTKGPYSETCKYSWDPKIIEEILAT